MFDFYIPEFRAGDAVYYTGEKYKMELTSKDGKPYKGWVHAPVQNQQGVFVCEFPDCKEPDFIIAAVNLTRARAPKTEKNEGPEIQPRRTRKSETE